MFVKVFISIICPISLKKKMLQHCYMLQDYGYGLVKLDHTKSVLNVKICLEIKREH